MGVIVSACKKFPDNPDGASVSDADTRQETAASAAERIADSVFLYAQTVYLWNEQLPTYAAFNPRQYAMPGNTLGGIEQELLAITGYALNDETGRSFEYDEYDTGVPKYSYVDADGGDGALASAPRSTSLVDIDGEANDLGLLVGAYGTGVNNYALYVQAVFDGSPADKLGFKRGDRITQINGASMGSSYGTEQETIYDTFYAPATGGQVTLQGVRQDGSRFSERLSATAYRPSMVLRDSIYPHAGGKIGYLAFFQFNNLEQVKADLDRAFDRFATEGVGQLVVDLRYNGGGYVETAEYLCNLIIPAAHDGKTMYSERFNATMQSGNVAILKNQRIAGTRFTYADYDYSLQANTFAFKKQGGPTAIRSVVFIVTGNTASASEMVANTLKPYVPVKLVGEKTYGKPVGFFPITIGGFEIYYSMFETRNAADEGGYYGGIAPDYEEYDDPRYDFGDLREAALAAAHGYLTVGSFSSNAISKVASTDPMGTSADLRVLESGGRGLVPTFKGMIENRKR